VKSEERNVPGTFSEHSRKAQAQSRADVLEGASPTKSEEQERKAERAADDAPL
jgi:hypothetical protein